MNDYIVLAQAVCICNYNPDIPIQTDCERILFAKQDMVPTAQEIQDYEQLAMTAKMYKEKYDELFSIHSVSIKESYAEGFHKGAAKAKMVYNNHFQSMAKRIIECERKIYGIQHKTVFLYPKDGIGPSTEAEQAEHARRGQVANPPVSVY
jgi:plasmid maintenance system killer protein